MGKEDDINIMKVQPLLQRSFNHHNDLTTAALSSTGWSLHDRHGVKRFPEVCHTVPCEDPIIIPMLEVKKLRLSEVQ